MAGAILGLGADLIDRTADHRFGTVVNEETGHRLDALLTDTQLTAILELAELGEADLDQLSHAGWLWYLQYLIPVGRLPKEELLIALWLSADQEVVRFRLFEAILANRAMTSLLDDLASLDQLNDRFLRWLVLGPTGSHPGVAEVETVTSWLYQAGSAPARRLLRAIATDPATMSPARAVIDSFTGQLDDATRREVREGLGLRDDDPQDDGPDHDHRDG